MSIQNDPTDNAMVDPEADPVVYYRPRQVIAVGVNARDWVLGQDGSREIAVRREPRGEPEFLLEILGDPVAVVQEAEVAPVQLQVQLNHVFRAHAGGPVANPCCGTNPHGIFKNVATPYRASPYRASSSPNETSAKKPGTNEIIGRSLHQSPLADRSDVHVWIIDTGLAADTVSTPLTGVSATAVNIGGVATDLPDEAQPKKKIDPVAGHGTFIAGIVEQLAPGCDIWVSDVIDSKGFVNEWAVATEIEKLVAQSNSTDLARTILNLSFGGGLHTMYTAAVERAIADAHNNGVVIVASAGNEESCKPFYPAAFDHVVAVGALDAAANPAEFTNRGDWVEACALGVDILSTFFDIEPGGELEDFDGWAIWSGTSFAAPVVVAAIASQMTGNAGMSAKTARSNALREAEPVPTDTVQCLGKRVDINSFSAKIAV